MTRTTAGIDRLPNRISWKSVSCAFLFLRTKTTGRRIGKLYNVSVNDCIESGAVRMQDMMEPITEPVAEPMDEPVARDVQEEEVRRPSLLLEGIAATLRSRGRASQRVLCVIMMLLLTRTRFPLGGYCCQVAMFAVLLRLGFCVPAAFAGIAGGFAAAYAAGDLLASWQLPACAALWLTGGLWARREKRGTMAAAVFLVQLTAGAVTGMASPLDIASIVLTALCGAALTLLYDGAALIVCHRDELDGETRPLCVMAVCASVAAGMMRLPYGEILACIWVLYLTLEHAYVGGVSQALLCAGVVGGAVSLCMGSVHVGAMLVCGGFLAGEIKTRHRSLCTVLMLCGMAAAGALLGGEAQEIRLLIFCLPGMLPFLLLPGVWRSGVTGLIERDAPQDLTQSEAIGVRCASMIHAWARLYDDTAQMMKALCAPQEENAVTAQCIQLLLKTSEAAHQVCERTLSEIRPDDAAFRRIRYALIQSGMEQVSVAYALRMGGRLETMLLKPEHVAPVLLEALVSKACGTAMRAAAREDLLCTQAVFEQAPALALEVGASLRSCSGEEVAGDSYISRLLAGGRHMLALSDGMGSGMSARQESYAALALMVESLRAGYTRAQALDVVNALMLMCTGREMYATMDLCVIDLHTGETAFEKLGACPSYVVRDGEVRAIGADTLPVGVLPDVESSCLRMTLRPGDVVILVTDGVLDAFPGGEEGLRTTIGKLHWLHPQAIGDKLIAQAVGAGTPRDDMAILCIRVGRQILG